MRCSRVARLHAGLWLWLLLALVPAGAAAVPAAVASAHPAATAAGFEVLAAGGNAFDAAVAVSAALAVVEPYSSGLGGGGFYLLHRAADGHEVMLDARERAPLAASADMYRDASGAVDPAASLDGALAAGIPGLPAALDRLAADHGRLPLARSLAPAITLAQAGFEVDAHLREHVQRRRDALAASPAAAAIFLPAGKAPAAGARLRQADLARTLQALAARGRDGFYRGPVARRLVQGTRAAGGIWQPEDLAQYRVVEREPVRGRYRDVEIVAAAPPSSGGVVLVESLNILAGLDLEGLAAGPRAHLVAEAMRRAYRDRAAWLGDPDFVDMPLARLLSTDYAAGLRAGIAPDRATPSALLAPAVPAPGGPHTTHFSIVDGEGNRVAATLSINYGFGSGFVPPGTGVVLNNEMDDFVAAPGVPNVYGLVGGAANAIAPGKRMLSSMTPTFLRQGERFAVLGTPGGSRIISMVLLATLAFAEGGDAAQLAALPRYHHQYLPDAIFHEPEAFDADAIAWLTAAGHTLRPLDRRYGNMQVVIEAPGVGLQAASDPRGIGAAQVAVPTLQRPVPMPAAAGGGTTR